MTDTLKKATQVVAYCSRTGIIQFGGAVPHGQVKLACGPEPLLRLVVGSLVRRSSVTDSYVADGVRKAGDDEAASQAAWDLASQIAEQLSAKGGV